MKVISIFAFFALVSCGLQEEDHPSLDHAITSDITDEQVIEFNQKIAGSWANYSSKTGEFDEGHSFKPSDLGFTGSMGYFASDASGETPYELISKKSFEHENKAWSAWIVERKVLSTSHYVMVCHPDSDKPTELNLYWYSFGNTDDCFADGMKTLIPFQVQAY